MTTVEFLNTYLKVEPGKERFNDYVNDINRIIDIINKYNYEWDYYIDNFRKNYGIIYKHPDVILKTDNEYIYPIRELYIFIPTFIANGELIIANPKAIKAVWLDFDFLGRVIHPHVSCVQINYSEQFICQFKYYVGQNNNIELYNILSNNINIAPERICFGEENRYVMSRLLRKFNPLDFELMIQQISDVMNTFSIESVPYVNIEEMINKIYNDNHNVKSYKVNFVNYLFDKKTIKQHHLNISEYGNIAIADLSEMFKVIDKTYSSFSANYYIAGFEISDDNNVYDTSYKLFTFKDEPVTLKYVKDYTLVKKQHNDNVLTDSFKINCCKLITDKKQKDFIQYVDKKFNKQN